MRDSNYRSVANNRAAVTITTSLYDRRALDVTSDKPLVNSLNHLTYLVSSSAKVRETLLNDGGIERLVEILHECHSTSFTVNDTIFNSEKKLLTAWKWTLAFQCLVLIGTRGTEKIRQKVVLAGMLPIIATVLDNYMTLHEGSFISLAGPSQGGVCAYMAHHFSATQQPPPPPQNHATFFNNFTDDNPASTFMNIRFPANTAQVPPLPDAAPRDPATSAVPATTEDMMNPQMQSSLALNALNAFAPQVGLDVVDHRMTPPPLEGYPRRPQGTFFNNSQINSLTSEDYDSLTVDQLLKLIRGNYNFEPNCPDLGPAAKSCVNNDIRRRYLIISIIKKLREEKECESPDGSGADPCEYDMDNNLQFLSDLYLQDEKSTHISNLIHSRIAPRGFTETGVVMPRDDDVVWCLQLLAYISKYPYLKDVLQNTHLIVDMSIRDKQLRMFTERQMKSKLTNQPNMTSRDTLIPRSRRGRIFSPSALPHSSAAMSGSGDNYIERFNPSPSNSPQMLSDLNLRSDSFDLNEDKLDLYNKPDDDGLTEDAEANDFDDDLDDFDEDSDHRNKDDDEEVDGYLSSLEDNASMSAQSSTYLSKLYDSIIDAESIVNDLDREIALFRISDKVNTYIEAECKRLSDTIIEKRLDQKRFLSKKWNYDTYANFDIDDDDTLKEESDYDESLIEYKRVNLFPMVEKFTFLAGTDMYYWSGVIMRNSCRRNDLKGGVRQCGNIECGRWEKFPREFSKCKRCKRTKYCSRECQMRAWHCHKNWCVPSNPNSGSTNTAHSTATTYDGQHDRTVNVQTVTAPSDSEGLTSNNGDLSRQVSTSDQDTQLSEL